MQFREQHWLEERIHDWASRDLISAGQAKALRDYEASRPSALGANAFIILLSIGAVCVALGLILLVSYNWELIPKELKIGSFLLLLALAGEANARFSDKPGMAATGLGILWLMFPLAGIGLYGEVFQLSGDPFKPLLVWLLLSLAPVWLSRNPAVAFLHTTGIVIALFVGIFNPGTMISLSSHRHWWWHEGWSGGPQAFVAGWGPALLMIGGLWALAFWQAKRFLGSRSRQALVLALIAFLFFVAFDWTVLSVGDLVVWVVPGALSALWWGLQGWLLPQEDQGLGWGVLMSASTLYWLTFAWHGSSVRCVTDSWPGLSYAGLLALGAVLGVIDLPDTLIGQGRAAAISFKALLLVGLALGLLLMAGLPYKVVGFSANLALLGFAFYLGWLGIRAAKPKLINWATALVGLLVVTRFIDTFGGLLRSGVAFIATGLLFMGLAWGFHAGRKRLLELAKGGAQ